MSNMHEPLAKWLPELNSIQISKLRAEFKRIEIEARKDELDTLLKSEAWHNDDWGVQCIYDTQIKHRIAELEKLL